jgi:hypothetical protein
MILPFKPSFIIIYRGISQLATFEDTRNRVFRGRRRVLRRGEEVEVICADPETGGLRRVGREVRPFAAVVTASMVGWLGNHYSSSREQLF